MPDRISEGKTDWRRFLKREQRLDGTKIDYVNPPQASKRQTTPLIELNKPDTKTRQTRQGTVEPDQPIRGGRTEPLQNHPSTKNRIP